MTSFNRRRLISLGLGTAGLSVAPSWLARWFHPAGSEDLGSAGGSLHTEVSETPEARHSVQDPTKVATAARIKQLNEAIARAQKEGKPLLLFVVPEDMQGMWQRGRWLGAFLNHASAVTKMEVALSVIACGKLSELKKLTGAKCQGKPVMVLVDLREGRRAGEQPKVTPIDVELGNLGVPPVAGEKWQDKIKREQQYIEGRLDLLGNELLKAMHRHGSNLSTAAATSMRHLGDSDTLALTTWFAGGEKPGDALLVRASAEVRRVAVTKGGAERKAMLQQLVAAFDRHVVKQPVAGSRWMIPGGCGAQPEHQTEDEKKNSLRIACGMAHTPTMCERFLSFYAAQ